MNRTLKIVTALMAVLAMNAVMVSPAHANFTASSYPAIVTGTSSSDVFDMFGSALQCQQGQFEGVLTAESSTLTIKPKYKCEAFGFPMTVTVTSCDFLFHKPNHVNGTVDVACSTPGDAIDINIWSSEPHEGPPICHMKLPAQTGKSGYTMTNEGGGVRVKGRFAGLTATQSRTSIFCPAATHSSAVEYTIQQAGILLTAVGKTVDVT